MVVGSVLALPSQTPTANPETWERGLFILFLLLGRVAAAPLSGLATLLEFSVRSYLVGNAGSRPISEAKQPWACLVLRWGTTGEAHVLYSLPNISFLMKEMTWAGCT